jgi:prepilin-type N-terminal cleavage/methylation domain-containing protein
MSSIFQNSDRKGFTLLEVMISLFILVMIGTTTSKAVIDAARLKEILKDETEFYGEFRTSTGFIERDLAQVFNPRWFLPPDHQKLDFFGGSQVRLTDQADPIPKIGVDEIVRRTRGTASQSFEYWGPVLDASGIRASRFQGKEDRFSFVAASHARIYQMKKESIYSKIRYEVVRQGPNPNLTKEENDKAAGLLSLNKIENTRPFELEEPREAPHLQSYLILSNIKKIRFTYFKAGDKDGKPDWDSETAEPPGSFPATVQMEVTLIGPKDRILEERVRFNLETPNELLPKTY